MDNKGNVIDLSELSTPQLQAIRQVLVAGPTASAEAEIAKSQLCHKSPPKGYPKEKSKYGDPECYRYPLDTKSRCLAAWRYVHQANNKKILGNKFKSVESKIKSYAKSHYDLDLQVGESEDINYEQAFMEYYDGETMGERCEDIILEDESEINKEVEMEDKEKIEALEKENKDLKAEKETWETEKTDLEGKASQLEDLTKELNDLKEEVETLRKFKTDTDEAAEKAERLKTIKTKLEEAGIEANFDDEAEVKYWLDMSEDVLDKTIAREVEIKKGASATAGLKVPPVTGDGNNNPVDVVREGLKEKKKENK
jgi:hypothetical protein